MGNRREIRCRVVSGISIHLVMWSVIAITSWLSTRVISRTSIASRSIHHHYHLSSSHWIKKKKSNMPGLQSDDETEKAEVSQSEGLEIPSISHMFLGPEKRSLALRGRHCRCDLSWAEYECNSSIHRFTDRAGLEPDWCVTELVVHTNYSTCLTHPVNSGRDLEAFTKYVIVWHELFVPDN